MTGILLTLVSRGSTTLAYTVSPVISGTAAEREVLTVSNGTWLGAVPITYSYQWFSNNAPVLTGATSYTVQASDIGYNIYCRVSATNFYGTIVAESLQTTVVTQGVPTKPVVTYNGLSTTGVTLNWSASESGITGYDVYNNTTKLTPSPITALTYAVTGLTAQSSYPFYVKAINAIGTTSSDVLNVITDANAPTGLTQSSITSTEFTLSWTVTSGVSYTIFNDSTQFGSAQTTGNVAITGLSPQTAYTFYVKATSTGSTNAISSTGFAITTAPAVPTGLSASAIGQNGFTINWTGVAGVTYQILNNTTSVTTGIVGTNGAMSYNVTGLGTYTSYPSFYVKASNISNGITSTTQSSPLSVQTTKAILTLSGAFGNSANVNTINNAYLTARGLSNSVPTDIYITNMYGSMSSSNLSGGIPIVVDHALSGTASGTTLTMTVDAGYSIQGRAGTYSTTNMYVLGGGAALLIYYAAEHGRINLINNGTIAAGGGVGGRGGGGARPAQGDVGQPGGDAIYINNGYGSGNINLYITNNGNIYGGGGGGGGGGCGTGTGSTSASSPSGASNWTGGSGTQGSQSPGYGAGGSGGGAGQAGSAGGAGNGGAGAGGAAGRAIFTGWTNSGFNWVTTGTILGTISHI
jgi:hypothetical protein